MSKSQREKGRKWEQAVGRAFREAMPGIDPRRGQQARDGADSPDVVGVPHFFIEAKHRHTLNVEAAIKQAEEACKDPTLWPIAVLRKTGGKPFVAMRLEDFLELVAAWWVYTRPEPPR